MPGTGEKASPISASVAWSLAIGAALFLFAAEPADSQNRGSSRASDESVVLGERPEPPRRAPAATPPSPASNPEVLLQEGAQDRPGPLGWFGLAAVFAALTLLSAGVAGAFDRNRADRSFVQSVRRKPSDVAVKEEETIPPPPTRAPASPAKTPLAALPKGPHRREAVGLLELHSELSPRRRRLAAYAYGARDLPPPRRYREGDPGQGAHQEVDVSSPPEPQTPPQMSAEPSGLEGGSSSNSAPPPTGGDHSDHQETTPEPAKDAAEDAAEHAENDQGAKVVSLIQRFAEGDSIRRPLRR